MKKLVLIFLLIAFALPGVSQIKKVNTPISKFVGTYTFDYCKKDGSLWNCPPIVVLSDGRCIQVSETIGGNKVTTYLGKVYPISSNAFLIEDERAGYNQGWVMEVNLYRNGREVGRTTYQSKWNFPKYAVFDIKEGRLYRDYTEYQNRDISTSADYTLMEHTKSTKY